jgi:hypothetical protein
LRMRSISADWSGRSSGWISFTRAMLSSVLVPQARAVVNAPSPLAGEAARTSPQIQIG